MVEESYESKKERDEKNNPIQKKRFILREKQTDFYKILMAQARELGCPTYIKYKADVQVNLDHLEKQYMNVRIKVEKK